MTPRMQEALDKLEPSLRNAFLEAIERITSQAQLSLLEQAIIEGDVERVIAILNLDPSFFAPLDRAINEAFWQGGVIALSSLGDIKDPFLVGAWLSALTVVTPAPKSGRRDKQAT